MKNLFIVSLFAILMFTLTIYSMYLPVHYKHNIPIWVFPFTYTDSIFVTFAYEQDIPVSHGILQGYNGRYLQHTILPPTHKRLWEYNNVTRWELNMRPVVEDHIHMDASFWINGVPKKTAEHDRNFIEYEPYEQKSNLCAVPGDTAYTKLWPHAGVHTHCDGLIHVHPWSAPVVLRKEGLDITMGMWFDQIGVEYYPNGIGFADGQEFMNNATHQWRIAEWPCYKKDKTPTIYTLHLDKIWLGHAYGSYVIWYGTSHIPPQPLHQQQLQNVGAHGFNHKEYPHKC